MGYDFSLYSKLCIDDTVKKYKEMPEFDLSFLCAMLKSKKPSKIVEIGVASGCTTSIIIDTLNYLHINSSIFSVDISNEFYLNRNRKTGFVSEKKQYNNLIKFYGCILPNVITEIGKEIDFVILDTSHRHPAELLDFLCILPFLTKDCVVILHDIRLILDKNCRYCTRLLVDTCVADKIFPKDPKYYFPNICAMILNPDTRKYISNVFSILLFRWEYMLSNRDLYSYHKIFQHFYSPEQVDYFVYAVNAQRYLMDIQSINISPSSTSEYLLDNV